MMQTVVTIVPILILACLSVYAVAIGGSAPTDVVATSGEGLSIGYLVLAYLAVYFAYSGWDCVIYVAGEVKRPSRNLPLGLIGGAFAATALYMLMCYAYLEVLGLEGLRHAGEAGTATARELGGPTAELAVTGLIALALMGALNGTILGGARVAFAMAKDGAMSKRVARIDEGRQVPKAALILQAILASVFVLTGTFEQIIALVSMAMILTGMFTVGSLFVLRIRQPHTERPYRALWYPVLPAIYLVSSIFVLAVMIFSALQSSQPGAWYPVLGLVIMLAAYLYHRIRTSSRHSTGSRASTR